MYLQTDGKADVGVETVAKVMELLSNSFVFEVFPL